MGRPSKLSKEMQERAVRLVQETLSEHASEWAAITSVASKLASGLSRCASGYAKRSATRASVMG